LKVARPGVRAGYDGWSTTYDETPNPLVALDRRYTIAHLAPRPAERILDAGCGTGAHLAALLDACSAPVGLDLSRGMLRVARSKFPDVPLAQADLDARLPLRGHVFDAVLCALVGEHLSNLPSMFGDFAQSLLPGGRLVFSVFHPEMAAAGIEANFERDGVEYRLGALRYRVADYLDLIDRAGFGDLAVSEFSGDDALAAEVPGASKYVGKPLLLVVQARRT
jgi:SAM-dependent methyltransferase